MSIIKEEDILKVLISYNPWWRNFEVPKEEVKEMKRKAFFCFNRKSNILEKIIKALAKICSI